MKVLSTPSINFIVCQVDEEKGILSKIAIARSGNAKSLFGSIDQTMLSQIQESGNSKENGIKALFGHSNSCSSSYGIYIGRFKNFQVISDNVYADLHLDPLCKDYPSGNLYNYIIKMAKYNQEEMLSTSVTYVPAPSEISLSYDSPFSRIQEIRAIVLSEDPDQTNSPFAVDAYYYPATAFLNANPAITQLISKKPEMVVEFLLMYFSNNDLVRKEIVWKLGYLLNGSTKDTKVAA
jgi:hypothetical protein